MTVPREAAEVEVITGGYSKCSEELDDDSKDCSSEKSEPENGKTNALQSIEEMKDPLNNGISFKFLIRDFGFLLLPISTPASDDVHP